MSPQVFLAEGVVHVWPCPAYALSAEAAADLVARWGDAVERRTAGRFVFAVDRHQYRVAHALLRRVLAAHTGCREDTLVFRRSPRGRPFLVGDGSAGVDFSLSHTRGWNAVAVARGRRVGVDVEGVRPGRGVDVRGIVSVFAPAEQRWVEGLPAGRRVSGVYRLWALKEAYAKARGLGLGLPFDSFAFELDPVGGVLGFCPPPGDRAESWRFVELQLADQVFLALAVSAREGETPLVCVHATGFPWRPGPPAVILPVPSLADRETPPASSTPENWPSPTTPRPLHAERARRAASLPGDATRAGSRGCSG